MRHSEPEKPSKQEKNDALTFTEHDVSAAINKAADDILDAVDAPGTGLRDALNLMVNAAVSYLRREAATLRDVIDLNYDIDEEDEEEAGDNYSTVLGWVAQATGHRLLLPLQLLQPATDQGGRDAGRRDDPAR
jgi:hypothetical protein